MRARPLLGVLLLLALRGGAARADEVLERYALDIRLALVPQVGRFLLRLEYRATGEAKRKGFKYLGAIEPNEVKVMDLEGHALERRVELEARSGEWRLDFGVPPPDARGLQVVLIEIEQRMERAHSWRDVELSVPWAHLFRIPVNEMRVSIDLPAGAPAPAGYRCLESGDKGRTCLRTTSGAEPVSVPAERDQAALPVLVLGLVAALGVLLLHLRARYQGLLRDKGVIPPASTETYPKDADPYRAPPPLPVPGAPVLPETEQRAFRRSAGIVVGAWGSVLLAAALYLDRDTWSLPACYLLALLALGGTLLTILIQRGSKLALALLPLGLTGFVGPVGLALAIGVPISLVTYVILHARAQGDSAGRRGGGWFVSSSSGSSCSSGGSSCSSSGGSSCGGGGGGCGGGGGGGGCGG